MTNPIPTPKPDFSAPPPQLTRRKWFRRMACGTGALAAGVVIDTFFIEPHWLEIVERDLPIRNLPTDWVGKRLVQISDIHVGHKVSDEYVIRSFQRVAEYQPEIVVVTGD